MTEPTGGSQVYIATIAGTWDPGNIHPITPETYMAAQSAAIHAIDGMIGIVDSALDFHLVATDVPGGPVTRTRWRLEADVVGPSLLLDTTDPHDSELNLVTRVYPYSEALQVVGDPDMPEMPYRGVYAPVIGALLLRHAWGPDSRPVTLSGFGTGQFTPESLRYRETWTDAVIEQPYDTESHNTTAYALVRPPSTQPPGMWLVSADDTPAAWQLSYAVATHGAAPGDRWDTPQVVPPFTPLDWPTVA